MQAIVNFNFKNFVFALLGLFSVAMGYGQEESALKPLDWDGDGNPLVSNGVKGDFIMIGNITQAPATTHGGPAAVNDNKFLSELFNNDYINQDFSRSNSNREMNYINVESGGDPSIFQSSWARMNVQQNHIVGGCFAVKAAYLYWSAPNALLEPTMDINKVKLKLPGDTNYRDIEADEESKKMVAPGRWGVDQLHVYMRRADITDLVQGVVDANGHANGKYAVANVAGKGSFWGEGGAYCQGGWYIVMVYENPATITNTKMISIYDGMELVSQDPDGFQNLGSGKGRYQKYDYQRLGFYEEGGSYYTNSRKTEELVAERDPDNRSVTTLFRDVGQGNGTYGVKPVTKTVTIGGFRTPDGNIEARMGVVAFEGDNGFKGTARTRYFGQGDYLEINAKQNVLLGNPKPRGGLTVDTYLNMQNDFFDSSITTLSGARTNDTERGPNPKGNLGFDIDAFDIPNATRVIGPGADGLNIKFGTQGESYVANTLVFSINVIAPTMEVRKALYQGDPTRGTIKEVKTNALLKAGEQLHYRIDYHNTGTADAVGVFIEDLLPKHIELDGEPEIKGGFIELVTREEREIPDAHGVLRTHTYFKYRVRETNDKGETNRALKAGGVGSGRDANGRIKFDDGNYVSFKIKVKPDCTTLGNACGMVVSNLARMTYKSALEVENSSLEEAREYSTGSFPNKDGCSFDEEPTIFRIDMATSGCPDVKQVTLCGGIAQLEAGHGFDTYKWYDKQRPTEVLKEGKGAEGRVFVVDGRPGNYIVKKTLKDTKACAGGESQEEFNVVQPTGIRNHPLTQYATNNLGDLCALTQERYVEIAVCKNINPNSTDKNIMGLNITERFPNHDIKWYRLSDKISDSALKNKCHEPLKEASGAIKRSWIKEGEGGQFALKYQDDKGNEILNANGTEFAVEIQGKGESAGCSEIYYFRVFLSKASYIINHDDILCGIGRVTIKNLSGKNQFILYKGAQPIPMNITWRDEDQFEAENSAGAQFTRNGDDVELVIKEPGQYILQVRKKVSDDSQETSTGCVFQSDWFTVNSIDLEESLKVETKDVLCTGNNPNTGQIKVHFAEVLKNVNRKTTSLSITSMAGGQYLKDYAGTNTDDDQSIKSQLSQLPAGEYEVKLTVNVFRSDGRSQATTPCSVTKKVTIAERPALKLQLAPGNTSCTGEKKIIATVLGGELPDTNEFDFEVKVKEQGATQYTTFSSNNIAVTRKDKVKQGELDAYVYELDILHTQAQDFQVEVIDKNSCTDTKSVTLPLPIEVTYKLNETQSDDCRDNAGIVTFAVDNIDAIKAAGYTIKYQLEQKGTNSTTGTTPPASDPNLPGLPVSNTDDSNWFSIGVATESPVYPGLKDGIYRGIVTYERGAEKCEATIKQEVVVGDRGGTITYSVGVSKLACMSDGAEPKAQVRVMNLKGGEPITDAATGQKYYLVQFDNEPWVRTTETVLLKPGKHSVRVKGNNEHCIAEGAAVIIEEPVKRPDFNYDVSYDCEGSANVEVSLKDATNYEYRYEPEGSGADIDWTQQGRTVTFKNIPVGTNTKKVKIYYRSTKQLNPNKIIDDTFGEGLDESSPQVPNTYTSKRTEGNIATPGNYLVTKHINTTAGGLVLLPSDHTRGGGNSRYLILNVPTSSQSEVVYRQELNDVLPGIPLKFKFSTMNVGENPIRVAIALRRNGAEIGRWESNPINKASNATDWQTFTSTELNKDFKLTDADAAIGNKLEVQLLVTQRPGIVAFDDILIYQDPKDCDSFVDLDIPVEPSESKRFKFGAGDPEVANVSCHGEATGKFSQAIDNFNEKYEVRISSVNPTTNQRQAVEPTNGNFAENNTRVYSISTLKAGKYVFEARPVGNDACKIEKEFTITEPDKMIRRPSFERFEAYITCDQVDAIANGVATGAQIKLSDYFQVGGGTPPYKYTVAGGEMTAEGIASDDTMFLFPKAGVYRVTITDSAECGGANQDSIEFHVKERKKPTLELTQLCNDNGRGAGIEAKITREENQGATYTYEYAKGRIGAITGMFNRSMGAEKNRFTELPGGWHVVKVTDNYGCSDMKEILVAEPITAKITVVDRATCLNTGDGRGNGYQDGGRITVSDTSGGTAVEGERTTYEYAFVEVNGADAPERPAVASSFTPANVKDYEFKTLDTYVDIWVRDTRNPHCHTKIKREVVRTEPLLQAQTRLTHPACATSDGVVEVSIRQGTKPYRVKLSLINADGSETPKYDESEITIDRLNINVAPGNYRLLITDAKNKPCAYTEDITIKKPVDIEAEIKTWRRNDNCTPSVGDVGFQFVLSQDVEDDKLNYEYLYSIDGGLTWSTRNTFNDATTAPGTTHRPSVGRFPKNTRPSAAGKAEGILCQKDFADYTVTSGGGFATEPVLTRSLNECTYNATVKLNNVTYHEVQYSIDGDGDNAPWETIQKGNDPAAPYAKTFNNLILGKNYVVHVRYKTDASSTAWCKGSTNINYSNLPNDFKPQLRISSQVVPGCAGGTPKIIYKLEGGIAANVDYQIFEEGNTFPVKTSSSAYNGAQGLEIIYNATIGKRYRIEVTERGVANACKIVTNPNSIPALPANNQPITVLPVKDVILGCTSDGTLRIEQLRGGSGSGYKFSIATQFRNNIDGSVTPDTRIAGVDALMGVINSSSTEIKISRNRFHRNFLATNPTEIPLVLRITDALGCHKDEPFKVKFAQTPKFKIMSISSCSEPNSVTIEPLGADVQNFYYVYVDEANPTKVVSPYNTSNVISLTENFDSTRLRIIDKETGCMSASGPVDDNGNAITGKLSFPKFEVMVDIVQQTTCTEIDPVSKKRLAKAKIIVKSGSGNYLYTIRGNNGTSIENEPFNAAVMPGVGISRGEAEKEISLPEGEEFNVVVYDKARVSINGVSELPYASDGDCGEKVFYPIQTDIPEPLTLNTEVSHVTCFGGSDGRIVATLLKAEHTQGPYEFELFDDQGNNLSNVGNRSESISSSTLIGVVYPNMLPGKYKVKVTSSRGCFDEKTITIGEPRELTVEVIGAQDGILKFTCDGTDTSTLVSFTLNVKGGQPPYRFSIDNGLHWQTVEEEVRDANGAVVKDGVRKVPAVDVNGTPVVIGGEPQFTYEYSKEYKIQDPGSEIKINWLVRDRNGMKCPYRPVGGRNSSNPITLEPLPKFKDIKLEQRQAKSCVAGERVKVSVSRTKRMPSNIGYDVELVTGPQGATLTPQILTSQSGDYITGDVLLPDQVGAYVFRITDRETKCSILTKPYIVEEPVKPNLSVSVDPSTACNPVRGSGVVFVAVVAGEFSTMGYEITLRRDGSNSVLDRQTSTSAKEHRLIDRTPYASSDMINGEYIVTVQNKQTQCETSTRVHVKVPDAPIVAKIMKLQDVSISCTGNVLNDGVISLVEAVSGGWGAPYQYNLIKDGREQGWSTRSRYEGLADGHYRLLVRDVNGCETEAISVNEPSTSPVNTVVLEKPTTITAAAINRGEPVSCYGKEDGQIVIKDVKGGGASKNYYYSIYNRDTKVLLENKAGTLQPDGLGTVTFENLPAGWYNIKISHPAFKCDELGASMLVEVPDATMIRPSIRITEYPACEVDGSLVIETTGGNGGYTFQRVNPDDPTQLIGAQQPSNAFAISWDQDQRHMFLVTDNKGCTAYTSILVTEKVKPIEVALDNANSQTFNSCAGDASGQISVTAKGGKVGAPYTYQLLDKDGAPISGRTNSTGTFGGLADGEYSVEVSQGRACDKVITPAFTIKGETPYSVMFFTADVGCKGTESGEIVVMMFDGDKLTNGNARKLSFAISPNLNKFTSADGEGNYETFTNLSAGDYVIIITDQNGCPPSEFYTQDEDENMVPVDMPLGVLNVVIKEPDMPLAAEVAVGSLLHESCLGRGDASFKLQINGGEPYIDENGKPYYMISKVRPMSEVVSKDSRGLHNLSRRDIYNPEEGVTAVAAGNNLGILVEDKNGCVVEVGLGEIKYGSEITYEIEDDYICTEDGAEAPLKYKVTLNVKGADSENLKFYLDDDRTKEYTNPSFIFPTPAEGEDPVEHTILIVSSKVGHQVCEMTESISIAPKAKMKYLPAELKEPSCFGGEDGYIKIKMEGGSGKYEYAISPNLASFDTNSDRMGLGAGFYTIRVRDQIYGCTLEVTEELKEPEALQLYDVKTTMNCYSPKDEDELYITDNFLGMSANRSTRKEDGDGRQFYATDEAWEKYQEIFKGEPIPYSGSLELKIKGGTRPYDVYISAELGEMKLHGESIAGFDRPDAEFVPLRGARLRAGKYKVRIVDANGCEREQDINVDQAPNLKPKSITPMRTCRTTDPDVADDNYNLIEASDSPIAFTYDLYVSFEPYTDTDGNIVSIINKENITYSIDGSTEKMKFDEFIGDTGIIRNVRDKIIFSEDKRYTSISFIYQDCSTPYTVCFTGLESGSPELATCNDIRSSLNIGAGNKVQFANVTSEEDLNAITIELLEGEAPFKVFFTNPNYTRISDLKTYFFEIYESVSLGTRLTYYVQKPDTDGVNPKTGEESKVIRVFVEDALGCGYYMDIYKKFYDIIIPNYFTPNDDGQNDFWAPVNIEGYPKASIQIYDRYGRPVASFKPGEAWNGMYEGEPMPSGDYWYFIKLNEPDDDRRFKGHFTLYR